MENLKKLFLLVIFLLGVVGCNSEKKKKEITIYTAVEEYLLNEYVEAFNREYPDIKLNIVSSGTGDIIARLISEKNNPQADVVWSTSDIMILKEYDLLEKYKSQDLEKIPEIFKSSDNTWFGTSVWLVALGINTMESSKIESFSVKSYEDLLLPELKGKILMANPTSSGTGYLTINTFINIFGEEKAWKYMDNLNKNIFEYTSSGNAPVQIVGRGENVIGFIPAYQGLNIMKEGQLPLNVIFPEEGLGWELEASALIKKTEVKPEAKIFLDWTLSENGMKLHSKNRGLVTIEKYQNKEGYPDELMSYLKKRDFEKELKNRDRILKEWERRYGKGEN